MQNESENRGGNEDEGCEKSRAKGCWFEDDGGRRLERSMKDKHEGKS